MADTEPMATIDDLEKRWRTLSDSEKTIATELIADASDKIANDYPARKCSERTLTRIVCQMVKRAMLNMDMAGVTQNSQTAGSYTESMTYSNPDGDLYLTSSEKRSLGIGRQHAFVISMGGHE